MPDVTTVIDHYIASFNEEDPHRRRALVDETFSTDARYLDPLVQGDGPEGIDAMIAGIRAAYPGTRFELAGAPDHHHDVVRFTWHLRPAGGGDALATGLDFATLADDGRLRNVTGFLEAA
jgi:hypothetical protein